MSLVKAGLKQSIIDGGMKLFEQGLIVGTWENLSVRDVETNIVLMYLLSLHRNFQEFGWNTK